MSRFINGNSVSGLFLMILGAVTALYSVTHYPLGTLNSMGSGMYPAALGTLLAICGAIILISAFVKEVEAVRIDYWALILIILGIVLFGLMINRVGLAPTTLVLIFMSNLAGGRIKPIQSIILAALVSAGAVLLFGYGLKVPLPAFRWPL